MMDLLQGVWGDDADREADGSIQGLAVAVVTDNKDPDGLARIRVSLPWQGESGESFWARIAMPMTGNEFGSFFLPEVGDEVLVGFDRGDMSHPFIIGSLWSGRIPPPETNADGRCDELGEIENGQRRFSVVFSRFPLDTVEAGVAHGTCRDDDLCAKEPGRRYRL